jgi:hypothetical protein
MDSQKNMVLEVDTRKHTLTPQRKEKAKQNRQHSNTSITKTQNTKRIFYLKFPAITTWKRELIFHLPSISVRHPCLLGCAGSAALRRRWRGNGGPLQAENFLGIQLGL